MLYSRFSAIILPCRFFKTSGIFLIQGCYRYGTCVKVVLNDYVVVIDEM